MVRKVLRFAAWSAGGLVTFALVAVVAGIIAFEHGVSQTYNVAGVDVVVPTDSATIVEGQRLYTIRGCADCHASDLGGKKVMDAGFLVGTFSGVNISGGEGSRTATFMPRDFDRAIRHGIGPDGMPLVIMPSKDYSGMSDEELGKIIAYITSQPQVSRTMPRPSMGPLMKTLYAFGKLDNLIHAEIVDHAKRAPRESPKDVAQLGKYIAETCTGCHMPDLAGGPIPGMPPEFPPAADIRPTGRMASYSPEAFAAMLKTGRTPEGKNINPEFMPWTAFSAMTSEEVDALYAYLAKKPAVASKQLNNSSTSSLDWHYSPEY